MTMYENGSDLLSPFTRLLKFCVKDASDDRGATPNRSGAITLPNKAAASGAEHASSRPNDASSRPILGHFFPKPRCARQVDLVDIIQGDKELLELLASR
jgi:hypothetical protein